MREEARGSSSHGRDRLRLLPLVALLFLHGCDLVTTETTGAPLNVIATGHDFHWQFTYAGDDNIFGSADDLLASQQLYLPAHRPIRLLVTSVDYIYTLRAPSLSLREVAVPNLTFELEFDSGAPGAHELEVDPLCAVSFLHPSERMGWVHVVKNRDFSRWHRRLIAQNKGN